MPNCFSGAEPHGEHDGGAVRIGDDLPLPAARALLAGHQLQVVGIDLRHQQRHIALHAVVARIGNHHVAGLREGALDLGGDRGIHGGEQQARRVAGLALFHRQVRDGIRRAAAQVPGHGVAVFLAGGAVAGAQPLQVEPGMALQELDEMLAHHAGGAEDAYFDSCLHNCLTIR